jgi:hypothetical protein
MIRRNAMHRHFEFFSVDNFDNEASLSINIGVEI